MHGKKLGNSKVQLVLLVLSQFTHGKHSVPATPSDNMGGVLSTREVHMSREFQSLYWGVCLPDVVDCLHG